MSAANAPATVTVSVWPVTLMSLDAGNAGEPCGVMAPSAEPAGSTKPAGNTMSIVSPATNAELCTNLTVMTPAVWPITVFAGVTVIAANPRHNLVKTQPTHARAAQCSAPPLSTTPGGVYVAPVVGSILNVPVAPATFGLMILTEPAFSVNLMGPAALAPESVTVAVRTLASIDTLPAMLVTAVNAGVLNST